MTSVRIQNLRVERGGQSVIESLSIEFSAPAWLGIIGANGSGKTTLLRSLAGRLPIQGGKIFLNDNDLSADRSGRAKAIGFAIDPSYLPAHLTPREIFSLTSEQANAAYSVELTGIFDSLELGKLMDRRCGTLSSGNKQRVVIFAAFLNRSSVVVLDEPFNWLDPVTAYELKIRLADYVAHNNILLITALHDLPTLMANCDRGLLIASGKISLDICRDELRLGLNDFQKFERKLISKLRS